MYTYKHVKIIISNKFYYLKINVTLKLLYNGYPVIFMMFYLQTTSIFQPYGCILLYENMSMFQGPNSTNFKRYKYDFVTIMIFYEIVNKIYIPLNLIQIES